jgi:hypothetical protein
MAIPLSEQHIIGDFCVSNAAQSGAFRQRRGGDAVISLF